MTNSRILQGKHIIVTGSNRGIGRAIVEAAAGEGADIWACARTKDAQFEQDLADLSKAQGVRITPVYFDLSAEESIKEGVRTILNDKEQVDGLVNNAGVPYGGLMQMTPISKLKEVFQINYFAPIQMMQLVSRAMMRKKSGVLVNIASVGGIETNPGYLAYGSSKAALIWATRMAAKELGGYGIRVNAVAPGLTDTRMGDYRSEEEIEKVLNRTALKRKGKPEDIAAAVIYLLSDAAGFVTGEILRVDGGRG